jgi:hypothetical protein
MRVERLFLFVVATAVSFALPAGSAERESDSVDRTFQRVADIPSGEAIVYVYRRRSGAGAGAQIGFDVNNGVVTGALWAGRYQAVSVPAGTVTVRARGVANTTIKCNERYIASATVGTQYLTLTERTTFYYLGVIGGPKWETTFQTEAGKEYFVELANGLRANLQTEQEATKHKLTSLKMSDSVYTFFSKVKALEVARKAEEDCNKE